MLNPTTTSQLIFCGEFRRQPGGMLDAEVGGLRAAAVAGECCCNQSYVRQRGLRHQFGI